MTGVSEKDHTLQLILAKLLRDSDPHSVAAVINHQVAKQATGQEVVDRLARYFEAAAKQLRAAPGPSEWPPAKLLKAFQLAAAKRGIADVEFYPRLIQRLVSGAEGDESAKMVSALSTRDRIIQASLDVFSDKGYHSATVDEIAERAGVGKGTLYRYFGNKEALFNEIINGRLEELERKALAVLHDDDDVLTLIGKYLRIYFEFFDQNQRFYRIMVQEHLDFRHRIQDLYIEKIMRRVPLLKRKIAEGKQQHILKDVDFQTVFYGVMGFIHGVIQKWLAHDCAYSLMDDLPTVEQVLFFGFVQPQRKQINEGGQ